MEMAYAKKKAESIITGLERPLNMHLIKLLCATAMDRGHWRMEVANWLNEIAMIRLKPSQRPANAGFYYRILFDEPFGDVEVQNATSRIDILADGGYAIRAGTDVAEVVQRLRDFHSDFAKRCAAGTLTRNEVKALVAGFASEYD